MIIFITGRIIKRMLDIGVRGAPLAVIPKETCSMSGMDKITQTSRLKLKIAPIKSKLRAARVLHKRTTRTVGYTDLAGGGDSDPISVKC